MITILLTYYLVCVIIFKNKKSFFLEKKNQFVFLFKVPITISST
jgi:hypothetical protein